MVLPEEGRLNLPCELLMGRTKPSHTSHPQITFFLQVLAGMNGPLFFVHVVPFAGTLPLDNLDCAFG